MNHFTLPRIGSGTDADPYRPDLPAGTSWVGSTDGADYLIATDTNLPDTASRKRRLPRQALENAAKARGRTYEDVMRWRVG